MSGFEAQMRIREKAVTMGDSVREVASFVETMNAKDEQITLLAKQRAAAAAASQANSQVPPPRNVRGSAAAAPAKVPIAITPAEEEARPVAKPAAKPAAAAAVPATAKPEGPRKPGEPYFNLKEGKLSAYDYKGWDKLAAELDDSDSDDAQTKAGPKDKKAVKKVKEVKEEVVAPTPTPPAAPKVKEASPAERAMEEKNKGNEHVKAGRFEDAVACYTRALAIDPNNAIVFSNRAWARHKLGDNISAEADATSAIRLDKGYAKAYHRRAVARKAQGNLDLALKDYAKVLEIEPTNQQAQEDVEAVAALLDKSKRKTRLVVEEVAEEKEKEKEKVEEQPVVVAARVHEAHRLAVREVDEAGVEVALEEAALKAHRLAAASEPAAAEVAAPAAKDEDDDYVNITGPPSAAASEPTSPHNNNNNNNNNNDNSSSSKKEVVVAVAVPVPAVPVPAAAPTTAKAFEIEFARVKKHPEAMGVFYSLLDPETLPKVLKESLTPEMLAGIAPSCIAGHITAAHAERLLAGFARCSRFTLHAKLMSKKDKEVLREFLEGPVLPSESLRKLYNL